jgi:hypothetical protein
MVQPPPHRPYDVPLTPPHNVLLYTALQLQLHGHSVHTNVGKDNYNKDMLRNLMNSICNRFPPLQLPFVYVNKPKVLVLKMMIMWIFLRTQWLDE